MKLLAGIILIIISIVKINTYLLAIFTGISIIPLLFYKKGPGILFIIFSFLPVIILPSNYQTLLPASLKLILRFQGFFLIVGWLGNYASQKISLPIAHKTPLAYSILLALNIFPHISEFIGDSFNQIRLRRNWFQYIDGYISFLLLYLSSYADELGYEIDTILSEENK